MSLQSTAKYYNIQYTDEADAELKSSTHLNKICPKSLHWKGYQMIEYLHNNSGNEYFSNNRKHFSANVYSTEPITQDKFDELCVELLSGESLANFLVGESSPFHSKTMGYDPKGLFVHDTLATENNKLSFIEEKLPANFQECILYHSK